MPLSEPNGVVFQDFRIAWLFERQTIIIDLETDLTSTVKTLIFSKQMQKKKNNNIELSKAAWETIDGKEKSKQSPQNGLSLHKKQKLISAS